MSLNWTLCFRKVKELGKRKYLEYMLLLQLTLTCLFCAEEQAAFIGLLLKDCMFYQENRYVHNKFKIDCERWSFIGVPRQGDEGSKSNSRAREGNEFVTTFQRKWYDISMGFILFPVTSSPFKTYFEDSNTRALKRLSGLDLSFQALFIPIL